MRNNTTEIVQIKQQQNLLPFHRNKLGDAASSIIFASNYKINALPRSTIINYVALTSLSSPRG